MGFCPNNEKGKAFRTDIKAILKGTGFSCVARGYSLKDWCNNKDGREALSRYWSTPVPVRMAKELSLYLRPIYSDMVNWHTESEGYKTAETLAVGMVLAVRKIHNLHGNTLNCK